MTKKTIFIAIFFISYSVSAQEIMKKIKLKEGAINHIKLNDLDINTLLQIYSETSAEHLIGDIYCRVGHNHESIAEFYIDHDDSTKEYHTQIYRNYFLTFETEENNKFLIIEKAEFGKAFALSSNRNVTIGNKDDLVEIEITDFVHEWGYDAPSEDSTRDYFNNVNYTLKVKTGEMEKNFNFYSSEITPGFMLNIVDYSIQILSDKYKDSSCFLEMIILKE